MGTAAQNMGCGASLTLPGDEESGCDDSHSSYDGAKGVCGTRTDSAGRRTMQNYSKITASAGEHTQHCLWIMVLKQDKYQPKYTNLPLRLQGLCGGPTGEQMECPAIGTGDLTPCTGSCLYPTYGVGTVFEKGTIWGDATTITEAIYPSKIVLRSTQRPRNPSFVKVPIPLVITYTIVATPGGAEIGLVYEEQILPQNKQWKGEACRRDDEYCGTGSLGNVLAVQIAKMRRFVEAEAQAILAESPLPSEAAVRQLQPAAGTMITVPQGSSGGQQLTVQTASGPVTCVVPEGMVPGNQFMIRPQEPAPGPAPVPMQQAPIQQQPAPIQDQVVAMQQQPVPAQTLAKFCTSCGTRAVAEFCSGCGARVV